MIQTGNKDNLLTNITKSNMIEFKISNGDHWYFVHKHVSVFFLLVEHKIYARKV